MVRKRAAFTLLEVLISVGLLSLVLLGLYRSLDIQRRSNRHLHETLRKTLKKDRALTVLYRDLLACDGRIDIVAGEFDRLCILQTSNSLYGLSKAAVCWLVGSPDRTLLRVEGPRIRLPLAIEDRVAIDRVAEGIRVFRVTREGDSVWVVLKAGEREFAFRVQGIVPPERKQRPQRQNGRRSRNAALQKPEGNTTDLR